MKKLGVVLGGGGAWSLAGLGVLKTLEENGIKIDYIAGCSMGAIIGAAYASQFGGEQTISKATQIMKDLRFRSLLSMNPIHKFGLFSSDKFEKALSKEFGDLKFDQLQIPLSVNATNFKTGESVILNSGEIVPAITASASYALIFAPYQIGELLLTDGGLSNPLPVDVVKQMGADIVLAVDVISTGHFSRLNSVPDRWHHKITKYFQPIHFLTTRYFRKTFIQFVDILFYNINRYRLGIYKPDFHLTPPVTHMDQFGFQQVEEFIKEGSRAAEEIIPELKKALQS